MGYSKAFLAARSYIAILVGFFCAFGIVLAIQHEMPALQSDTDADTSKIEYAQQTTSRPLNLDENIYARVAWQFFENNTTESGLVRSRSGQEYVTLWDVGSYIFATLSAYKIGLIEQGEYSRRINNILNAIPRLELNQGMPFTYYNVHDLKHMTAPLPDTDAQYSIVDTTRFLNSLRFLVMSDATYRPAVTQALSQWKLDELFKKAFSASRLYFHENYMQHERDASRGYGFTLYASHVLKNFYPEYAVYLEKNYIDRQYRKVDGFKFPEDRDVYAKHYLSMIAYPYLYSSLENGQDYETGSVLWGLITINSKEKEPVELQLDRPDLIQPDIEKNEKTQFVLNNHESYISTKSVFGLYAIYRNTDFFKKYITGDSLINPGQGWYDGYIPDNKTINTNVSLDTNAMILESLDYIVYGPMSCVLCKGN